MIKKLRLNVTLLLPETNRAENSCVLRLVANLDVRDGGISTYVVGAQGKEPAKFGARYKPEFQALFRIRQFARNESAKIIERLGHLFLNVERLRNQCCARTVGKSQSLVPIKAVLSCRRL